MKHLWLILFIIPLFSQENNDAIIDSLQSLLNEKQNKASFLDEQLKLKKNEITKIENEISKYKYKASLNKEILGDYKNGFKMKPTRTGFIMYGEDAPDRFDNAKFSTLDELTIFREMIELRDVIWYKAMHKGKLGWINRPNIAYDEHKIPFIEELGIDLSDVKFPDKNAPAINNSSSINVKEELRLNRINNKSSRFKSQMKRREVVIGMTMDEVHLAIGYPKDKNKSTYSFGTKTQLVYDGKFGYKYIYLDDGIVVTIQE